MVPGQQEPLRARHQGTGTGIHLRFWAVPREGQPTAWKKAVEDTAFAQAYTVEGDRLKRPPKGFDPDHELVEVLKFKDFTGISKLTQKQVISKDFIDEFAKLCLAGGSLVRFICDALDQPY